MLKYNPFEFSLHEDPYPVYGQMRENYPLYRNDDLDFWALSRHSDVYRILRDSKTYSSAYGASLETWGPNARRTSSFIAMDPPEHTRVRGLISHGFTKRSITRLEPRIRSVSQQYLAKAMELESFDFIADYAARIPMDIIFELIGVPAADRPEMARFANLMFEREENVEVFPATATDAARKIVKYYSELVSKRRRDPADDLTSVLLNSEPNGISLSDSEIVTMLFLLGVAGNETTTKLIGNAWYWAWRNPDQRTRAFSGHVADWVEETLRYDSAGQVVLRRAVTEVNLYGTTIPVGARLLLLEASANRDPRVFPHPDRFDIGRDTSKILSFGSGIHFCLGAALARLTTQIALHEITAIIGPDYDIDTDGIRRAHSTSTRGFAALPTYAKRRGSSIA